MQQAKTTAELDVGNFDVSSGRKCNLSSSHYVLIDLPAEQARGEVDQQQSAFSSLIEERIELHEVERRRKPGLVQKLHHQMCLAVCGAAGNGRADAGRNRRIEE